MTEYEIELNCIAWEATHGLYIYIGLRGAKLANLKSPPRLRYSNH
jgi:hypothetical protein